MNISFSDVIRKMEKAMHELFTFTLITTRDWMPSNGWCFCGTFFTALYPTSNFYLENGCKGTPNFHCTFYLQHSFAHILEIFWKWEKTLILFDIIMMLYYVVVWMQERNKKKIISCCQVVNFTRSLCENHNEFF